MDQLQSIEIYNNVMHLVLYVANCITKPRSLPCKWVVKLNEKGGTAIRTHFKKHQPHYIHREELFSTAANDICPGFQISKGIPAPQSVFNILPFFLFSFNIPEKQQNQQCFPPLSTETLITSCAFGMVKS